MKYSEPNLQYAYDVMTKIDAISIVVSERLEERSGLDRVKLPNSEIFGARFGKDDANEVAASDEEADERLQQLFPETHKHIRASFEKLLNLKQAVAKYVEAYNDSFFLPRGRWGELAKVDRYSSYLYQLQIEALLEIESRIKELDDATDALSGEIFKEHSAYCQAILREYQERREAREAAVVVAN